MSWLSAPLPARHRGTRLAALVGATGVMAAFTLWRGLAEGSPWDVSDGLWYEWIAEGKGAAVLQPFASRPLGPLVARGLASLLHLTVRQGFAIEAALALLLFLATVVVFAARSRAPVWALAAIAFTPMLADTVRGLLLPDLFYAALLAMLLVWLERGRWLLAAAWMFPLMAARESSILTLVCLLVAAWKPLRLRGRLLAVTATLAGAALVHHLSRFSPGNEQHLPAALYMLLKVPWNASQNLLGLRLWNDVNNACGVPVWQHALHLGSVHAVGFCGASSYGPRVTAHVLLTEFGLLPLLALSLYGRRRRRSAALQAGANATVRLETAAVASGGGVMLRFCAIYGGTCFLIAPLLGATVSRLLGYGWPLFFVAVPAWMGQEAADENSWLQRPQASWLAVLFLALQFAVGSSSVSMLYLPLTAGIWVAAGALLWLWSRPASAPPHTPAS